VAQREHVTTECVLLLIKIQSSDPEPTFIGGDTRTRHTIILQASSFVLISTSLHTNFIFGDFMVCISLFFCMPRLLCAPFFFYLDCETIGTAANPGLLCQPRVIMKMIVESMMECKLAGETEVLGENLPQRHFCRSQNPTCPPGFEPGPPRWEAGD
jgi:hypothetical protein